MAFRRSIVGKSIDFSIIDKGLTVEGMISSKGKLIIRGTVKGTLVGETVIISKEGAVFAETTADSMTIGGTFEGEIRVSRDLVILSTGSCTGKVIYKDLVVEPKGILNAQAICNAGKDSNPGPSSTVRKDNGNSVGVPGIVDVPPKKSEAG